MRISYLLVADAHNRSDDGKDNFLGADWRSVRVPSLPADRPMVVAFSVIATEDADLGSHSVRGEVQDADEVTIFLDETLEFARIDGPPGLPLGAVSGQWGGIVTFTAAGVHTVRLTVGPTVAETVFVVHVVPDKAGKAKRPSQKGSRGSRRGTAGDLDARPARRKRSPKTKSQPMGG